ncbi:MAG: AMP-binding protein, partial [Clostridia bacterium]|nr:AMP-binding protein [Clostridia bacterium]
MKLSFSTNGWKLPFIDLIRLANDNGIKAVEIHSPNASFGNVNPFSRENINGTVRLLRENSLSIAALDAPENIAAADYDESYIARLKEDFATAENAKTEYVRIHAYLSGDVDEATADALVRERLPVLLKSAIKHNVILLMESMGIYADTGRLKTLLEDFADDNLAALWDLHHTVHFGKEKPETTIKNLGAYVKHVHVKDSSVDEDGNIRFGLMGEGTLPIEDALNSLKSINYDGYVSLELRPEQLEEIGSPDIVFPQFVAYMQKFDVVPDWKRNLYYNKAGTGRFVWKKEELIDCTFPQVLDRMCKEFPDQIAFKYTTLDYTRTYYEFREDVNDFARTLIALGVRHGDKVAAWATNVPEWYIAFWAATKIGAILVTVNTAYKIHEAEYLLRQSDTRVLVMTEGWRDSNYKEIINELCPELKNCKKGEQLHAKKLPFLRNVSTVGFTTAGAMTFKESLELKEKVSVDEVNRRAAAVKLDDCCNMQYTSGTTGFPKGVMLTHYNVVNNGKCIGDRMDLSTADRMMIQVPMFHCFGMVLAMTASMTHGVSIRPIPYFSPKPALACINSEKITCFHGVPTMFIAMLNNENFPTTDFSHMRTGIMA